jgi:tRNA U38,U39,U40 pseudouridine synthase TruA
VSAQIVWSAREEDRQQLKQLISQLNTTLSTNIRVIDILPLCAPICSSTAAVDASTGSTVSSAVAADVECEFHAKRSATGRRYEYLMPTAVFELHVNDAPATAASASVDADRAASASSLKELHRTLHAQKKASVEAVVVESRASRRVMRADCMMRLRVLDYASHTTGSWH